MKLRTLIADDEPLALSRLKRLLSAIPAIELIGEASNGSQLVLMAENMKPELIISDIKMPGKSGLEAVQEICLSENPPAVIFCTAFDQFAVKAFEMAAIGYLVKPIVLEGLKAAIDKSSVVNQVQLSALANKDDSVSRLLVDGVGSIESVDLNQVDYFNAEDKAVIAHLSDREIVVDYSLNELAEMLGDAVLRVHRSTLVNVSNMKRVFKTESGHTAVEFESERQVMVSRRMVASVKQAFKKSID